MLINGRKMKPQGGFTLIELIVVMLILAILGVTAAPKFWNFQKDARISALNGLKSAIDSANALTFGKSAMIAIEDKAIGKIPGTGADVNVGAVDVVYGYPAQIATGLGIAVTGLGFDTAGKSDWLATNDSEGGNVTGLTIQPRSGAKANCFVTFKQATANLPATATITTTGC